MSIRSRYQAWVRSLSLSRRIAVIVTFLSFAAALGGVLGLAVSEWRASRPIIPPESLSLHLETTHLSIHTDLPENEAKHYARFFDEFYDYFSEEYYPLQQDKKLVMLLFGQPGNYDRFCTELKATHSPFGFYMGPRRNTIVVNHQRGLGTAAHELTHHFMALGKVDLHPAWVNEGIPTFFEKFVGHLDGSGDLQISFGYFSNWRFPITNALIEEVTLEELFQEENQCLARSFILFLHHRGYLQRFVRNLHAAGQKAKPQQILLEIYGEPLETLEADWKAWVRAQPIDDQVSLVPASFVKTPPEWATWIQENEDRLRWDETRKRYVVRKRGAGPSSAPKSP